jgi:hypothetical protein
MSLSLTNLRKRSDDGAVAVDVLHVAGYEACLAVLGGLDVFIHGVGINDRSPSTRPTLPPS